LAEKVQNIENILKEGLLAIKDASSVRDVRILGAIGVVEMKEQVDMANLQQKFVELGVWIRPFGKLIYLMPPYVISDNQLNKLICAIKEVVSFK